MKAYVDEQLADLGVKFSAPKAGDAGYDLYSVADVTFAAGGMGKIPTGVYVEIPNGYVGIVKDRSSMALAGLHALAGVIDSSYRGEIQLIMLNVGAEPLKIEAGRKVAQLVVLKIYAEPLEIVPSLRDLTDTERGAQGFGSTGE